jgi:hypothetical protein
MGGAGSGQWYRWNTKLTVENCRFLDVREWHRQQLLRPGAWFMTSWSNHQRETIASIGVHVQPGRVLLSYRSRRSGEDWQDVEESISLIWTPCHYGGQRPWFICPGVVSGRVCGRRVAKLYLRGGSFRCRDCHRLAYASQREARCYQAMNRAHKIQERLGGRPGFAYPFPPKPKGMHWRTYERWQLKFNEAVQADWGVTVSDLYTSSCCLAPRQRGQASFPPLCLPGVMHISTSSSNPLIGFH